MPKYAFGSAHVPAKINAGQPYTPPQSPAWQRMTSIGQMPMQTTGPSGRLFPETMQPYDPDSTFGTGAGSFNAANNWSPSPSIDLMLANESGPIAPFRQMDPAQEYLDYSQFVPGPGLNNRPMPYNPYRALDNRPRGLEPSWERAPKVPFNSQFWNK